MCVLSVLARTEIRSDVNAYRLPYVVWAVDLPLVCLAPPPRRSTMRYWFIAILLLAHLVFIKPKYKSRYTLEDHYTGYDFLSVFKHQAIPDPTHGCVNFISEQEALERGLTVPSPQIGRILLRSGAESVLDSNGPRFPPGTFAVGSEYQFSRHLHS